MTPGWKDSTIQELTKVVGRGKSPVYADREGIPILNQACIQNEGLDLSRCKFITQDHFRSLRPEKIAEKGDVLVNSTGTGTLGRIGYWDSANPIPFDSHVTLLRFNEDVVSRFFYYVLGTHDAQRLIDIYCVTGSTNQVELSRSALLDLRLKHPLQKSTQDRIIQSLDIVQRQIDTLSSVIAKQERVRVGLLQALLTRGTDHTGKPYKRGPFGKCVQSSAFGPRFPGTCYSTNGNVQIIRTTDMDSNGCLALAGLPKATLDIRRFEAHLLRDGDLLVSRSGTIGVASVFDTSQVHGFTLPGAFLIRFRLNSDNCPRFWQLLWNSPYGRKLLTDAASGGVQQNLRGSSILALSVAIPSYREQVLIREVFDAFDASYSTTKTQVAKLHRLKTGLMRDLLTGKISVEPLLKAETNP